MTQQDDAGSPLAGDGHGAAHGGWRRAAVGLVFGAGLGLLARILLGSQPDDDPGRRDG